MESNSIDGLCQEAPKVEMTPPMTFHALPYVIFRYKTVIIKPIVAFHCVTKSYGWSVGKLLGSVLDGNMAHRSSRPEHTLQDDTEYRSQTVVPK